jgi:hypothetical protein
MAMALRPLASEASMNSRYGSQVLRAANGVESPPAFSGLSVITGPVDTSMAGFAGVAVSAVDC